MKKNSKKQINIALSLLKISNKSPYYVLKQTSNVE